MKTTFKGRITFKILFVFAPRRRGNGTQLTPCQCRLQQVGRIGATGLITRPNDGVRLIDKQQHRDRRLLHRGNDIFQALLKLAFHSRSSL
ncbi:hypothetical protein D3C85_1041710 [compost metagenome]